MSERIWQGHKVRNLPVTWLLPRARPTRIFSALLSSIATEGIQTPLAVSRETVLDYRKHLLDKDLLWYSHGMARDMNGGVIWVGNNRFWVAKALGILVVPCVVTDAVTARELETPSKEGWVHMGGEFVRK